MTYCKSCGKALTLGSRFCPSCGASTGTQQVSQPVSEVMQTFPQEIVCPSCGKKLNPRLKFCPECGTDIKSLSRCDSYISGDYSGNRASKGKLGIDQQIALLEKLKSLLDAGVITQEEFEKKKKEII